MATNTPVFLMIFIFNLLSMYMKQPNVRINLYTYIVPFGTVIFSPSKITFGLRFGPYFLKARLTHTACLLLASRVEACVWNCALRVFNSREAVGGGLAVVSISMTEKAISISVKVIHNQWSSRYILALISAV